MKTFIPVIGLLLVASGITAAQEAVDAMGDPLPAEALQRLGTLRMRGSFSSIGYLPDGRGVVSTGNSVQVWDLAHGKRDSTHQVSSGSVASMKVSRDGTRLLFISGGDVLEWSLATGEELHRFPTGQSSLAWVCYSPDESRVLTMGSTPPTLKEFALATGEERISITGDMAQFASATYGPGGTTAFVGGGYQEILARYDLTTGEKLHQWFSNYAVYRGAMHLSADEERLLVGSRSMATEWKIDGYEELRRFTGHHGGAVNALAYCLNPDEVLTGSRDGSIRHWNRLTGDLLRRWYAHEGAVGSIAVSPDGQYALSYGGGLLAETVISTGRARLGWERHAGSVTAAAWVPGTDRVISGSSDGTLRLWDLTTGESLRAITGAELGAWCVAVSPDGSRAAAGCKDGVLREFRIEDGELLRELRGHLGYVRSAAYAGDGERVVSSADDGSIRVWSADRDEAALVLRGHLGGVLAIAVSADGQRLLTGGRDGTVRLWDLAAGEELAKVEGHRGWVEAVAFVGDESGHAVAGGRDGRIIHWDLEAKQKLAEIEHGGWLRALAVSSDGRTVYSAGDDREVAIWDLPTRECRARLTGHVGSVNALALCGADGPLVSASADTSLLVWARQ
jgi:WD40 repeat protein